MEKDFKNIEILLNNIEFQLNDNYKKTELLRKLNKKFSLQIDNFYHCVDNDIKLIKGILKDIKK